jgi:hypothetical protein
MDGDYQLVPVEGDPFAPQLVPVDHDPFQTNGRLPNSFVTSDASIPQMMAQGLHDATVQTIAQQPAAPPPLLNDDHVRTNNDALVPYQFDWQQLNFRPSSTPSSSDLLAEMSSGDPEAAGAAAASKAMEPATTAFGKAYVQGLIDMFQPPDPDLDPEGATRWAWWTALNSVGMGLPSALRRTAGAFRSGGDIFEPEARGLLGAEFRGPNIGTLTATPSPQPPRQLPLELEGGGTGTAGLDQTTTSVRPSRPGQATRRERDEDSQLHFGFWQRPVTPFRPDPAAFSAVEPEYKAIAARLRDIRNPAHPAELGDRAMGMLRTNGPDLVGSGPEDLLPKHRDALRSGELPAYLAGEHAEMTVVRNALRLGLRPRILVTDVDICGPCRTWLESDMGARVIHPKVAIWPQQ